RHIVPKLGVRGQARLSDLRLHSTPISSPHPPRSAYSADNFGREETENGIAPRTQGSAPRKGGVICSSNGAPAFLLGPVDDPDALGEIRHCHFPPAPLRGANTDILYRLCPRHRYPAALGRRGVLVLLVRRGLVVNRVLWPAAPDACLRFRTRTDACIVGAAHGRTG